MAENRRDTLIVMGVITAAHGIRGEVKLKSFTEVPEDIAAYGPLLVGDGPRTLEILSLKPAKGQFIARLKGVADRNAAEALKGVKLKVPRSRLPETEEDEYYHEDLVGLTVEDVSGEAVGRICAVQNFGAGDLLEIRPPEGRSFYVPFTRRDVPEVDLAGGRVVIRMPEDDGEEGGS